LSLQVILCAPPFQEERQQASLCNFSFLLFSTLHRDFLLSSRICRSDAARLSQRIFLVFPSLRPHLSKVASLSPFTSAQCCVPCVLHPPLTSLDLPLPSYFTNCLVALPSRRPQIFFFFLLFFSFFFFFGVSPFFPLSRTPPLSKPLWFQVAHLRATVLICFFFFFLIYL